MPIINSTVEPFGKSFGKERFIKWFYGFLILAVAAYLRLRGLQTSEIAGDQSALLRIAMNWVNGGYMPLAANKSSAGIMNPPLIEYLLAWPLFLRDTISAAQVFQALMSIAAVGVLYGYAVRLFGKNVGLMAALLLAVNPWAVFYGRFIWNPNPIPLFSTLLLMQLISYFVPHLNPPEAAPSPFGRGLGRGQSIYLALSFLWLAAITQLHLSGLALIGVMGLVMLLFWRRWQRGRWWQTLTPILIGMVLFLLLYVPFLRYERATGFMDIQTVANALTGGRTANAEVGEPVVNAASWLLTLELAAGDGFWDTSAVPRDAIWQWFWLADVARMLVVLSLFYALASPIYWRFKHINEPLPKKQTALLILAVWMIVPVLLYLRHTVYLQNYYFLYLYPAPFLALGLMLEDIRFWSIGAWRRHTPTRKRPSSIFNLLFLSPILLLAFWQFNISHTRLVMLETGTIGPEQQAQHIEQAIAASRTILERYPGCDLTIASHGGSLENSQMGVLKEFVHPTPVRFVDVGRGYIHPARCTIYFTAVSDPQLDQFLTDKGEKLPEQIETRSDTWHFYHVPGLPTAVSTPLAIWQNGLTLLEVTMPDEVAPGEQVVVTYVWQVTAVPPNRARYHFFNHVMDESEQLITQEDAPAIDSLYWQPGDQLVTQFYLTMPPDLENGRFSLRVGLYTWPDLERVPLLDEDTLYRAGTMGISAQE